MEEGLFPNSRTLTDPAQLEEERRLCYVGMTRAMDTLILTRARYRRRYGNDSPDSSMPSRFLDEVPARLIEDLSPKSSYSGSAYAPPYPQRGQRGGGDYGGDRHYSYEDESQEPGSSAKSFAAQRYGSSRPRGGSGPLDNTAAFFGKTGALSSGSLAFKGRPRMDIPSPTGKTGLAKGSRVRHPKYGDGIIFAREGDGEDAKLTVQFSSHGMKKLVEKFAQLERL
jgi:DNA helicase-2/ATP-dependent DNA helicase PcrA